MNEQLGGYRQHVVLCMNQKQPVGPHNCSLDPAETVNTLLHFAVSRTAHAVYFGLEPQICALGYI